MVRLFARCFVRRLTRSFKFIIFWAREHVQKYRTGRRWKFSGLECGGASHLELAEMRTGCAQFEGTMIEQQQQQMQINDRNETISEMAKNYCVVMSLRWWKNDAHSRKICFKLCGYLKHAASAHTHTHSPVTAHSLSAWGGVANPGDIKTQATQLFAHPPLFEAERLMESHADGYIHECVYVCVWMNFVFLYRFHINLFVFGKYVLGQ